jgi:hypothetical protein
MKHCLYGHILTEENVYSDKNGYLLCKKCRQQRDKKRYIAGSPLPQSGVAGVTWYKRRNKWKSRIAVNGQEIPLGFFAEKQAAIAARQEAEHRYGVAPPKRNQTLEEKQADRAAYNKKYYLDSQEQQQERARTYRKRNPEKIKATNIKSRRKRKAADPIKFIITQLKRRSAQRGIPFDLLPEHITLPEFCEVCGTRLVLFGGRFKGSTVSADKLQPNKGYTNGNVKFICIDCNTLKRDCIDPHRFRAIADYIERNLPTTTFNGQ